MDFKNKNVLVCGMAKSGIASAKLLKNLEANVTLQDIKEESKLGNISMEPNMEGINLYIGKNPDDIVEKQDLIVISPGIPIDLPFIEKAGKLSIPVWGEIELAYSVCRCPIIGITGTNGKTTTTALTGKILGKHNYNCKIVGNIGIPFTQEVLPLKNDEYVVAEISSFQLESTHNFKPHIAAILNVTPDHINRHKTLENYIEMKKKIFINQQANDFAILNYDDPVCRKMADGLKSNVVFFSRKEKLAKGVYVDDNIVKINLFNNKVDIININQLQIFGGHNVLNVLAAVAMTYCANVPINIIQNGLIAFKGVEHRLEYVCDINKVSFYNDSKATNVDSAIKSIEAIERPIVLIGGGSDKGCEFGSWIKMFNGKVKSFIVIGEVKEKIIETCKAYNYSSYDDANSLKDAVELAYSKAVPGDCVLLSPACASFDMFGNYEQRGELFKEFVIGMRV